MNPPQDPFLPASSSSTEIGGIRRGEIKHAQKFSKERFKRKIKEFANTKLKIKKEKILLRR